MGPPGSTGRSRRPAGEGVILREHWMSEVRSGDVLVTAAALAVTFGVATACWVVVFYQMAGMNLGVETRLGSFSFFAASWIAMMAAMMLPGATPAVLRRILASRRLLAAPVFSVSYIAVWSLVGIGVYTLYRPHGTAVAGIVVMAAGIYELTPAKRHFRLRCHQNTRSGLIFGLDCLGSSAGLMAILVVLGAMDVTYMAVIAAVVVAQKFLPARVAIDVPLALAIVGLGIVILAAPSAIPGLVPAAGPAPPM